MSEPKRISATITAQNTFTDAVQLDEGEVCSISGIGTAFTGTAVIQRRLPGQTNFQDVPDANGVVGYTAKDFEVNYTAGSSCEVRAGVKTGGFGGTNIALTITLGK
jgi:hypothetical protein